MKNQGQFKTHNDVPISIDGTHLQGYADVSYQVLCDLFGPPCKSDGYKVDAEWVIRFPDGQIATIYNWKNGFNYLGPDGTPVEEMTEWNIGGHSNQAVTRITELINSIKEKA